MKNIIIICALALFAYKGTAQSILPSTAHRIAAADFVAILESPEADKYMVFNTGPVNDIKNAINIGAVEEKKNLKKLKKILKKLPKDTPIVYYCGCCPFATCPNLLPAAKLLEQMNFTNYQALDLPKSLKLDWIAHDYPMKGE